MKYYLLLLGIAATHQEVAAQTLAPPSQLPAQPSAADIRRGGRPGPELSQTGWYFASVPKPEFVDEKPGTIRFRVVVNSTGTLDSITTVSSNMSAKQEATCRQALQTVQFTTNSPAPNRAVGFYTFKFTVR
ncbi:hypothetical protein [Hymenobacter properus]|uniref:TonB C-terminal domain-containing protein n=1 Tax=Hymenobacter properus TaxID=2791026 RepID=A0A931BCC9_9BACT|nr:hypothetical protein [Hymenobacter properus]MBF9140078.1 hypothetical protein [Hymenobacter properus]MBR7718885.1 hypothetical protein [Microvirga sp. SRT04]